MCSSCAPAAGQISLKVSSATSESPSGARATPDDGQRSANSPTRADSASAVSATRADPPPGGYPLAGPSNLPDPRTHAYRTDLADAALAGRVIASHYADPLKRLVVKAAPLLITPDDGAEVLAELEAGETLDILDNSRGWAWGYAGEQRLVGYVRSDVIDRA